MVDFNFWRRWLLAVGIIIAIVGAVFALFSWSPLFGFIDALVNATFWPGSVPDAGVRGFQLWAYGVLGGTIAGWGVFLAYMARYPFSKKEKWSWDCIALGVAVWFLIDTPISAYTGAYFNVAINLVLLALVALPLAATKKEFIK